MNKWGCFIRSCLIIAELQTNKELTAEQINELEQKAIDLGYVNDKEYKVENSAKIIQLAFEALGIKRRVFEIGTSKNSVDCFYTSVSKENRKIDAKIKKIKQSGPSKYHFIVVKDEEIIDPHYPRINDLGEVYTILYIIKE